MKNSLKTKLALLTMLTVGISATLPAADAGFGRGRGSSRTSQVRRSNSGSSSNFRRTTSNVRRSTQKLVRRTTQRTTQRIGNQKINRNRFQNTRRNTVKKSPVKSFPKRNIKISPVKRFPKGNFKRSPIKISPKKGSWKNKFQKNHKLKKFPVKNNWKKKLPLKKNFKLNNLVKKHGNQKNNWKGKNLKHWNWGHWNHNHHHNHHSFHWRHNYHGHRNPWYSRHHGWGFGSWSHTGWNGGYCGFGIVIDPCYTYYNPYYVVCDNYYEDVPFIDYSQPLVIGDEGIQRTEDGVDLVEAARIAFARGEYTEALKLASFAAQQMPNDPDVHQLRSMVLFALGDFKEAAAAANAALTVGAGWSWDAIQNLYGENPAYTTQYRGLEAFVASNPNLPEGRFLLGYHYLMLNYKEAAQRELAMAVRLQPKDQVSSTMLKSLTPQPVQPQQIDIPPTPQTDVTVPPQVGQNQVEQSQVGQNVLRNETKTAPKTKLSTPIVAIPRAMLLGNWTASPDAKTKISLGIKDDGTFAWNVQADTQKTELKGTFELAGDKLVLKRGTDSQKLEGKVKSATDKGFEFTLIVNGKEAVTFKFARS